MDVNARSVGRTRVPDESRIVLTREHKVGADFTGRVLEQVSIEGSLLEGCRFDNSVIRSASFGAGRAVSQYIGCSFDKAKITMGPGGYARFVDCTFDGTVVENWTCFAVELIGCTFSGTIRRSVFNGTRRPRDVEVVGAELNRFEDNDFSRSRLIDVGFRTGINLAGQQLPRSAEYVYLPDAREAVLRAREAFNSWTDPDIKKRVRGVLVVMEEDVAGGQEQLLIRPKDYPAKSRAAIQELLRIASG